jgi:DNA polymerase I
VTDLKILNKIQDVEELLDRGDLVALTAPLILDHTVIVGFYNTSGDQGCIEISEVEFNPVARLLFHPARTKIAVHGLKRIWEALEATGVGASELDLDSVTDTKLLAYLLNSDGGREEAVGLSLTHLAHEFLHEDYPHMAVEVRDKGIPAAIHEALVRDARTIFRLAEVLPTHMDRDLFNLYRRVELPLMLVLDRMRRVGVGLDGDRAYRKLQQLRPELESLADSITEGATVDLSSNEEVFTFLVRKGVRFANPYAYTAQKVSTPLLEELALQYSGVQAILDWREMHQDVAFLSMAEGKERIYPVWGQTRSGTSRIYARQPAVQNVSRRLRYLFVPAPGHVLVKADYSQAQLRILAHLSGDDNLMRVFTEGGDVHGETARLLGIDRDLAKQVNFGICFGISAPRLAARINSEILKRSRTLSPEEHQPIIDETTAQGYIDQFHDRYPAVRAFFYREWRTLKRLPQKDRVARSPLGRVRRFDSYPSKALERSFRVTWPQQIEADLIKTAMLRLDRIFRRRSVKGRFVMIIHDALWVEAPHEEENQVRHLVERMMITAGKLAVPLDVDIK